MYMCTSYAPIYDLPVCASTANAACISAFLLNQVSSGTLQFRWARPAVAAVTNSVSCSRAEAVSPRGAPPELTAGLLLHSCELSDRSEQRGCGRHSAGAVWASELAPTWPCLQELQSQQKLLRSYALKY